MKSCIYRGTLLHRRKQPRTHSFRYNIFMMYIDLDELPRLFDRRWLWSTKSPAVAWFRRRDYLGDAIIPLDVAVRDEVERLLGQRPKGPIRVLTHLRYFGYVMNPVTFYYCFDSTGETVQAILAEITNTPWNERHVYALGAVGDGGATDSDHHFAKEFHVSPFMDMGQEYRWLFSDPGQSLDVHMENSKNRSSVFEAILALDREEITGKSLAGVLVRFPFMTARVALAIYWQATLLWLKRTPFFPNPGKGIA